jgi:hypothetical protein
MDNDPPYFGLFLVLTLGVTIEQQYFLFFPSFDPPISIVLQFS